MSDIKINCDVTLIDVTKIKPYSRNPRNNDATVKYLTGIIPKIGFNVPIVVDENHVIVKGHSRYFAGIKLGMVRLPCIISTNNDEQNNIDRLSDNRASELADWDVSALRYELESSGINILDIWDKEDKMFQLFQEETEVKQREVYIPETVETEYDKNTKKKVKYAMVKCRECGAEIYIDIADLTRMEEL